MNRFLLPSLFFASLCLADSVNEATKEQTKPYSEAEKKALVDENVEKFAKKKHKNIISVPVENTHDDYLKGSNTTDDPLENFNRVIYTFNGILDMIIVEPLAYIYRDVLHHNAQKGISNFWTNIQAPLYCVNHLLQGNMNDFFQTSLSFVCNTTIGLLGFLDFTSDFGLKRQDSSFDQTLACWGMESGPYLVLPIFGGSSFRGAIGVVGDMFIDPVGMITSARAKNDNRFLNEKNIYLAVWGIHMIDTRASVIDYVNAEIKKAPDPYVVTRSALIQRRTAMENELKNR